MPDKQMKLQIILPYTFRSNHKLIIKVRILQTQYLNFTVKPFVPIENASKIRFHQYQVVFVKNYNTNSSHTHKFVGFCGWLCRATINPLHFAFCTKLNAHNCTQVSRFKYFFIPLTMHLRKSLQNIGRLSKCYIIF